MTDPIFYVLEVETQKVDGMVFYSFETISFLSEVVNFMLMLYCNACSMDW